VATERTTSRDRSADDAGKRAELREQALKRHEMFKAALSPLAVGGEQAKIVREETDLTNWMIEADEVDYQAQTGDSIQEHSIEDLEEIITGSTIEIMANFDEMIEQGEAAVSAS